MSEDGVAGVGVGCIGEGRREILLGCGDVPRCCFCLNRCDGQRWIVGGSLRM